MTNILLTGASGFLGQHVYARLRQNSNDIVTLGRTKISEDHNYVDFSKGKFEISKKLFKKVIHLASKAHVNPTSDKEIKEFEEINCLGTIRLLDELELNKSLPEVFIFASTVAVYGLDEGEAITESSIPNPDTAYGKSKLNAEKAIIKWCDRHDVKYVILRLPLIAGANPPGNLGKMIKAIGRGRYVRIKNNVAKKSVVLASDIADLIAQDKWVKSGIYNLTDGIHPSFMQIEEAIAKALNKKIKIQVPQTLLEYAAFMGDLVSKIGLTSPVTSVMIKKITNTLTFDDSKAREELGWNPKPALSFLSISDSYSRS